MTFKQVSLDYFISVDPDGRYPRPLMMFNPKLGFYGGYKLKKASTHLLSLVSGVPEAMIQSEGIDIYCLYEYYNMSKNKRYRKGFKCFDYCSDKTETTIINH